MTFSKYTIVQSAWFVLIEVVQVTNIPVDILLANKIKNNFKFDNMMTKENPSLYNRLLSVVSLLSLW